jgi:hypothetical protein
VLGATLLPALPPSGTGTSRVTLVKDPLYALERELFCVGELLHILNEAEPGEFIPAVEDLSDRFS